VKKEFRRIARRRKAISSGTVASTWMNDPSYLAFPYRREDVINAPAGRTSAWGSKVA
jgi:hypothetical protein